LVTTNARDLRLVLADDHPLISHAIREYLHRSPDIHVVAVVERCADLDGVIREHHPDMLLLDLSMEPGCSPTSTIRRLRRIQPALKIVVLSAHGEVYWVLEMLEARVDGYIHKTEPLPVLAEAVRRVAAGEVWFSHHLLNALAAEYDRRQVLDEHERVLLQAIADGKDLTTLSANLHVSRRTAERYLASVIKKLGVGSRLEAVTLALRQGVIE
jgi:DNA-binding NarL/FixJ family response regulator